MATLSFRINRFWSTILKSTTDPEDHFEDIVLECQWQFRTRTLSGWRIVSYTSMKILPIKHYIEGLADSSYYSTAICVLSTPPKKKRGLIFSGIDQTRKNDRLYTYP